MACVKPGAAQTRNPEETYAMTTDLPFTPQSLSLTHLVRPPQNTADEKPPLLLLLHGVGSNERDLMGLSSYLNPRFLILSLRGPFVIGPNAFGWYPVEWTANGPVGDAASAKQSRDLLTQFVPEAVRAYNADASHVILMGFSQGAIMSLYVGLHTPEITRALVPMSGRLLPEAWEERASDDRLTGLPIFAVHGTRDNVLPIAEGRAIRDELSRLPANLTYREYPMGHEVSAESLADISAFLTAQI